MVYSQPRDHQIQITGTYAIPEFSTLTAPIIMVAVGILISVYKKKLAT